jgi:hypothetical protein
MAFSVRPADCEKCAKPLKVTYQDRRHAWAPMRAWIIFALGVAATVVGMPVLFLGTGVAVALADEAWGLPDSIFYLGDFAAWLTIPFSFIPAVLAWRYFRNVERNIPMPCRKCGHTQNCQLLEDNQPEPVDVATEAAALSAVAAVMGAPRVQKPVGDDVSHRAKQRRRKKSSGEEEPYNPDFDFDKPEPPPK